jgi:hypothetical protein
MSMVRYDTGMIDNVSTGTLLLCMYPYRMYDRHVVKRTVPGTGMLQ